MTTALAPIIATAEQTRLLALFQEVGRLTHNSLLTCCQFPPVIAVNQDTIKEGNGLEILTRGLQLLREQLEAKGFELKGLKTSTQHGTAACTLEIAPFR